MADPAISEIFDLIDERYRPGVLKVPSRSYYFSLGEFKYTLKLTPEGCACERGKTLERADVVLKTTPKIFLRLVMDGRPPGPIDIARGRFKTNDVGALTEMKDLFDFTK